MGIFDRIFKSDKGNTSKTEEPIDQAPQAAPASPKQESLIPKIPEKEFGTQLVQLIDVALADKILTSSERSMLRDLAMAKNVDMDKFEAYVDYLKDKRGVKEIEDGAIPLKKYNQPIKVTSELQNMIDMALADGYLSDEERKIILNEAAKLGVNMREFEAGLDAIFMTGHIKQLIDSKYPTTVTRRFIKSEDIEGGKVVDTYEEITVAYKPNTNRGKGNQLLKTTTKKTFNITRRKEMMEEVVDFLCSVDYGMVLSALAVVTVFSPAVGGVAVALVSSLKGGVDKLNSSGRKKDPQAFFDVVVKDVAIDKCVEVLPGVQKYLGNNGEKIVSGLMTAHTAYKANRKK